MRTFTLSHILTAGQSEINILLSSAFSMFSGTECMHEIAYYELVDRFGEKVMSCSWHRQIVYVSYEPLAATHAGSIE